MRQTRPIPHSTTGICIAKRANREYVDHARPHDSSGGNPAPRPPALEVFRSARRARWLLAVCLVGALAACKGNPGPPANQRSSDTPAGLASQDADRIIQRFREANGIDSGTLKVRVTIQENGSSREVRFTIYRRREADGSQSMLIEFTHPLEERDRSSLITIDPQGELEATRYAQSSGSFVTAKGASSEDSLFGISLQELAEGQPEKYNFTLAGEEIFNSAPVYRLEGRLKERADSKFPRVIVLISKDNYATRVAEFYDHQNNLIRRIEAETFLQFNGHFVRTRFTIDNLARKKKLDFDVLSTNFEAKLSSSLFSREYLKKISAK